MDAAHAGKVCAVRGHRHLRDAKIIAFEAVRISRDSTAGHAHGLHGALLQGHGPIYSVRLLACTKQHKKSTLQKMP